MYELANTNVVGGNGYRWRGRSIRTVNMTGVTCVTMPRRDSVIMVPCNVSAGTKYTITITASKSSGNGALLINFFGNKKYDGVPIPLNIDSTKFKNYTIVVIVPNIPKSMSMYLRVWRPDNATGTANIKTIQYSLTNKEDITTREPRLQKISDLNPAIAPKVFPKPKEKKDLSALRRRRNAIKEQRKQKPMVATKHRSQVRKKIEVKTKPYKKRKITDKASAVLVRTPNDVPKVSIITPTRDGIDLLQKCYDAIKENTRYPNWEWIIGDSESTDGTAECVKEWKDARVKLVERKTTEGSFSSINNELVKYADGAYLLFLNNDTEPQEFWLYEMMSKIHNKDKVGAVGAKLLYKNNYIQHAGISFVPQGPANIGRSVLKSFPKGFENHDRYFKAVTGACLLMRTCDFNAVHGFDPIYYFCYEDVDLCLKIERDLKKRIVYAANAVLYHAESVTQSKHKTAGVKQQAGIKVFKDRWMINRKSDFLEFRKNIDYYKLNVDVSFVTCVNDMKQYCNCVGSLFKNKTQRNYEIIPILNYTNQYSASQALNLGIDKARSNIVVLCHQDVLFYEDWVDLLFERIEEVEKTTKKWGVLGTAGITKRDDTVGVVHNIKGDLQWQATKRAKVYPVQTVDEHCMIIRKNSGLRFDEKNFNGFHFYGPDICLDASDKGFTNFGILCPLAHVSASGSLISGKKEFMRLLNNLAKKWQSKFARIRTPTSIIRKSSVRTFVRFKRR